MNAKAAILGASGLVGDYLLDILLKDERYTEVISYSRKPLDHEHPKLKQVVGDLLNEEFYADGIKADHVYCCIGTTQSKTPDLSTYKAIDYGIPVQAAKAAIPGGMESFVVISSMGASRKSKTFYLRNKAHMEAALEKLEIEKLRILRPALLTGSRKEVRLGEKFAAVAMKLFNWVLPKKYRSIHGSKVAKAMHRLAFDDTDQVVFQSNEIRKIAQSRKSS